MNRVTRIATAVAVLTGGAGFAADDAPAALPPAVQAPAPVVPLDPTAPAITTDAFLAPGGAAPLPNGVAIESAPVTAAPVAAAAPAPADSGGFKWKDVPRTRPLIRPGNFPNPPLGTGYYSLLDQIRGEELKAPPKWPYPRLGAILPGFFDLDNFAYLDDPKNAEFDYTDPLHRIRFGDWLFVTGGELRSRYENRYNDRLTQMNNDYTIGRIRTYGDLWYKDDFRVFVEGIFAGIEGPNLPRAAVDENKADFLNLFVDVKLAEMDGKPAYVRVGRQELLLGSQRLVSPLDWANNRRTFQGVRGFRQTEKWDFDAFWVQPVIYDAHKLDSVDNNRNFAGIFNTFRPKKGHAYDAYYLMLDSTNRVREQGIQRSPFTLHTFGGRAYGNTGQWLHDVELAMQLGTVDGRDSVAGMATVSGGYYFQDAPLTPTVWAAWDYASGGGQNGGGTVHTFNQLFPFGHYYLGWLDQVGRQNIHDVNFHVFAYPAHWLTTWFQFHSFWLADAQDALYGAGGQAYRRSANGTAGTHVGEEVDVVLNFHLTKHIDMLTGYSYLWGGEFLRNTSGPNAAANGSMYFLQMSYRW